MGTVAGQTRIVEEQYQEHGGASRKRGRLQWFSNMRSLPWVKGFGVWGRSTADRVASASFHTCVMEPCLSVQPPTVVPSGLRAVLLP